MSLYDKIKQFESMVGASEKQKKAYKSSVGDTSFLKKTLATAKKFDIKLAQEAGPSLEGGYSIEPRNYSTPSAPDTASPATKPKAPAMHFKLMGRDGLITADAIRNIQGRLGFTGKGVDGIWGPNSFRALESFKKKHSLPGDGNSFDAATAQALGTTVRGTAPTTGLSDFSGSAGQQTDTGPVALK